MNVWNELSYQTVFNAVQYFLLRSNDCAAIASAPQYAAVIWAWYSSAIFRDRHPIAFAYQEEIARRAISAATGISPDMIPCDSSFDSFLKELESGIISSGSDIEEFFFELIGDEIPEDSIDEGFLRLNYSGFSVSITYTLFKEVYDELIRPVLKKVLDDTTAGIDKSTLAYTYEKESFKAYGGQQEAIEAIKSGSFKLSAAHFEAAVSKINTELSKEFFPERHSAGVPALSKPSGEAPAEAPAPAAPAEQFPLVSAAGRRA